MLDEEQHMQFRARNRVSERDRPFGCPRALGVMVVAVLIVHRLLRRSGLL
ncbi:hypothetical protein ACWEPL_59355 [Nonomuraea sp. NPDC004186]